MAAETGTWPVFVRFGDLEEQEVGTVTAGVVSADAATMSGPYPLDFTDTDDVDRLRVQVDNLLDVTRADSEMLEEARRILAGVVASSEVGDPWRRWAQRWLGFHAGNQVIE